MHTDRSVPLKRLQHSRSRSDANVWTGLFLPPFTFLKLVGGQLYEWEFSLRQTGPGVSSWTACPSGPPRRRRSSRGWFRSSRPTYVICTSTLIINRSAVSFCLRSREANCGVWGVVIEALPLICLESVAKYCLHAAPTFSYVVAKDFDLSWDLSTLYYSRFNRATLQSSLR